MSNIMAFGFSLTDNLSAQHMGYLGATLAQVFTRERRADVSLRDVTIAQMGNGVTECRWRHAPEARGGNWEVVSVFPLWSFHDIEIYDPKHPSLHTMKRFHILLISTNSAI